MPKFTFKEFETTTAVIQSRGVSIDSSMGVTQIPATTSTITGSFHRLKDEKKIFSAANTLIADAKLITSNVTFSVSNGNVALINGDTYEITGVDLITSFIGSYKRILLRQVKE